MKISKFKILFIIILVAIPATFYFYPHQKPDNTNVTWKNIPEEKWEKQKIERNKEIETASVIGYSEITFKYNKVYETWKHTIWKNSETKPQRSSGEKLWNPKSIDKTITYPNGHIQFYTSKETKIPYYAWAVYNDKVPAYNNISLSKLEEIIVKIKKEKLK